MAYNLTNLTQANGFYEAVIELNVLSDYRVGLALLVGFTIIFVIGLIKMGTENYVAIMGGGTIMAIASLFMMFSDLLSPDIALPFIIVAILISVIGYMLRS